jgi:hypothetical protein
VANNLLSLPSVSTSKGGDTFTLRRDSFEQLSHSNLIIKQSVLDYCLSSENVGGIVASRFCIWKGHKADTVDLMCTVFFYHTY